MLINLAPEKLICEKRTKIKAEKVRRAIRKLQAGVPYDPIQVKRQGDKYIYWRNKATVKAHTLTYRSVMCNIID